jgi:hypothetical protein
MPCVLVKKKIEPHRKIENIVCKLCKLYIYVFFYFIENFCLQKS